MWMSQQRWTVDPNHVGDKLGVLEQPTPTHPPFLTPAMPTTVISSPGKVLLAGGYLVLDPAYSGVVVSTSSRFYTVVRSGGSNAIRVQSPQFLDATWTYSFRIDDSSKNPAVHIDQVPEYVHPLLSDFPFQILSKSVLVLQEQVCAPCLAENDVARA